METLELNKQNKTNCEIENTIVHMTKLNPAGERINELE